ncbi:ephrin type-A receptor 8-like [Lethenteron reissneri]|uniref:ephrin type-A receptor 8-like n=1 Tax=Lethenteron reissneri TaxID=7753 RepID=UPI002AB66E4E|nr:ephrin type-A receptor 8-like [Lethenteron reissneri]
MMAMMRITAAVVAAVVAMLSRRGHGASQLNEVDLLNTMSGHKDQGWTTYPDNGWEEISEIDEHNRPLRTFQVCNVMSPPGQSNWLRSPAVPRGPARRLLLELRFTLRDCGSIPGVPGTCKETFNLYFGEEGGAGGAGGGGETPLSEDGLVKIDTIAADESFTQVDVGERVLKLNTEVRELGPLSGPRVLVALQDVGACVALLSLRLFYKRCPATRRGLTRFPQTVAGADASSLVEVQGQCAPNAGPLPQGAPQNLRAALRPAPLSNAPRPESLPPSSASSPGGGETKAAVTGGAPAPLPPPPRMFCSADGEWLVPIGSCGCRRGG